VTSGTQIDAFKASYFESQARPSPFEEIKHLKKSF